jgi:hypothetical protein
MVYFYVFFLILVITYMSGFFDSYKKIDLNYNIENSNSIIEFLTKHKTKTKNYSIPPGNYASYNSSIPLGKIIEDKVQFRYEFPLVNSKKAVFDCFLHPSETSSQVDLFGLNNSLIIKNENGFILNTNLPLSEFSVKMNQYCWFFNSVSDWGVDYKKLIHSYISFTKPISRLIYDELIANDEDNYFNRVQAALNFVQFLPYGLPEFDSNEWYYFGISTPPESFILGYSDCDSKSIFFASILSELIPIENIILINCTVNSGNESSNGEHMMVAVSDLVIPGQSIDYNSKSYLLLETTTPIAIGQFDWTSFKTNSIIYLK